MSTQNKPIAVLISDIHFTPATLELASSALIQAHKKALSLEVPLIIAGDTLDSKAIIRGECANRLISIFQEFSSYHGRYILVGNHDMLNEKGEEHSLNFLKPYCDVVQSAVQVYLGDKPALLMPYYSDPERLRKILSDEDTPPLLIMHQGVQTADMGHYVQDKTSLPKECFQDFRVVSGHYHKAQDIKCGRPRKGAIGLFSYIGTPYTTSFGEANDGPKGFQILYDDGSLELMSTNLRKHVIIEIDTETLRNGAYISADAQPEDLIWLKVSGSYLELEKLNKREIGMRLFGHVNFKLDKICIDVNVKLDKIETLTGEQILDTIIDATDEKSDDKAYLKTLWREVL